MKGLFFCKTCSLSINDSTDVILHVGAYPDHIVVTGDRS